MIDDVILMLW